MNKTLFKMALLNLSRNQRRTGLTLGGIALGTTCTLMLYGFVQFSHWGLAERFSHSGNGHLQIAAQGYFDGAVPEQHRLAVSELERITRELRNNPALASKLESLSPRRKVTGIVGTSDRSDIFSGYAVEPDSFSRMASLTSIVEGEGLDPERPEGVLLGRVLADRIGARVGDSVSLLVSTDSGRTNAMDVTVAGLTESDSKQLDAVSLILPVETALRLYDTNLVDGLVIGLKNTEDTASAHVAVKEMLASGAPNLVVKRWEDLADYYQSVRALYGRLFSFMEAMFFLLTLLAVTNTLMMALFERRAEMATLQAIGMQDWELSRLILWEGALLGLVAGIAGVAAAGALSYLVRLAGGLPMPPPPGSSEGYHLQFLLDWTGSFAVLIVTLMSTALASWLSARTLASRSLSARLSGALRLLASGILAASFAPSPAHAQCNPRDASSQMAFVDSLRQIPPGDFRLEVRFTPSQGEAVTYLVANKTNRFLAVAISDPAGSRIAVLSSGSAMWMQKENMRKPIRISPAQRLIGQASNADVAGVRFADDYEAQSFAKGTLVLKPRSGNSQAAYGRIEIDMGTGCKPPPGAKLFALSGKLLKTVRYQYGSDKRLVSAKIEDALRTGDFTQVSFGPAQPDTFPESFFNPESLSQSAGRVGRR